MAAPRFVEQLNQQVANEFAASQQYVAAAVFYDAQTLPRLAAFFYAQALEERGHALMMVQYLMDAGARPLVPGVGDPVNDFEDLVHPVRLGLEQERRVTDQISALTAIAREEGDFQSEGFMQWFLKEQVEEIATMSDLVRVVERSRESPMLVEEYLAREHLREEAADPTAPPAAGGAL